MGKPGIIDQTLCHRFFTCSQLRSQLRSQPYFIFCDFIGVLTMHSERMPESRMHEHTDLVEFCKIHFILQNVFSPMDDDGSMIFALCPYCWRVERAKQDMMPASCNSISLAAAVFLLSTYLVCSFQSSIYELAHLNNSKKQVN